MDHKRLGQIEKQIASIKQVLRAIGAMRPGSLTKQFKDRDKEEGAFWQISYTARCKAERTTSDGSGSRQPKSRSRSTKSLSA